MHPLLRKTLIRLGLFHVYGLMVAWIFTLIEKEDEPAYKRMDRMLKELKTELNTCVHNMTDDCFENFVTRAAAAVKEGDELDWTFPNSLAFAFASFTTIGYGNITPRTQLGRGFTIISCLLGIPITMMLFKTTGELLASCITYLVVKTETVMLKRAEPKHFKTKTFLSACALIVFQLIIVSACTIYLENWNFVEGLYAWFITYTTIGFGDYVHMESLQREIDRGEISPTRIFVYFALSLVPYVFGLSLMSCILSCLVDSVDEIRNFRERVLNCCPNLLSLVRRVLSRKIDDYPVNGLSQGTC